MAKRKQQPDNTSATPIIPVESSVKYVPEKETINAGVADETPATVEPIASPVAHPKKGTVAVNKETLLWLVVDVSKDHIRGYRGRLVFKLIGDLFGIEDRAKQEEKWREIQKEVGLK